MSEARNLIITGIPRSGTTLTAALIDTIPDAVCLNEPGWHNAKSADSAEGFAQFIADDFTALRQKLLTGSPVQDRRSPTGKALTNYYGIDRRKNRSTPLYELMPLRRPGLSPNFLLAVKHNGPYLAVLRELIALKRFSILAIVRNPVHVIHSWRSLDLPISHGRMPNAAPYWPDIARTSQAAMDLLEKQVHLYDLMCERIHSCRDLLHLVRYEELIKNPEIIVPATGTPPLVPPGMIKEAKTGYDEPGMDEILTTLKRVGRHWQHFYEL